MKRFFIKFILGLFILLALCCNPAPEQKVIHSSISITNLVQELLSSEPDLCIGWEMVLAADDVIDTYPLSEIKGLKGKELIKTVIACINAQTEYDCTVADNWVLILPHEKAGRVDKPIALRLCEFPKQLHIPYSKVLSSVKGLQTAEPVSLAKDTTFYVPNENDFEVSIAADKTHCHSLLRELAHQGQFRLWKVNHFVISDETGNPIYPITLRQGLVGFANKKSS